ncbi:MAG TPA: gluconokinase [Nocardioides sp.]|jgi:gluconokinase|nr:gluconokinase [Nocardioides sp.]
MSAPVFVVVMGVSGSGKTTLGKGLAERMHWRFQEGDDLHPRSNVEKMSRGEPLTDEDRWPWLDAIGQWLDERGRAGENAVLTCSALRRIYRDRLRSGRPGLRFIHVDAPEEILRERLEKRQGHYMPASLLPSQLATLEPLADDEPGVVVSATGDPDQVLAEALEALGLSEGESR